MNTQKWSVLNSGGRIEIKMDGASIALVQNQSNAELAEKIVRAVNEHAALGFKDTKSAQDHAEWLDKNGTAEFQKWKSEIAGEARHTVAPWRVGPYGGIYGNAQDSPLIAHAETKSGKCSNWAANEKFIVRAVNSNDGLLAALEQCLARMCAAERSESRFGFTMEINNAEAAIASAKKDS